MYVDLLKDVCRLSGTDMGEVHLVADHGRTLMLAAAKGLPSLWQEWTREIPLRTGIGAGTFGEAAVFKRASVATSLEDSKFDGFRKVAENAGIRAIRSLPLLGPNDRLVGTLTTLYNEVRGTDMMRVPVAALVSDNAVQIVLSHGRTFRNVGP